MKFFIEETVQYMVSHKIKSVFYNEISFLSIKHYCVRFFLLRSTEHSRGNKTVPEKVAATHTEDGHK